MAPLFESKKDDTFKCCFLMQFDYSGANLNGVIRHLVNTNHDDTVRFKSSSNYSIDRLPAKMLGFDEDPQRHFASSGNDAYPYFIIQFPFSIGLKQYSLRSSHNEINGGRGYMIQWKLEGSINGRKWNKIESTEINEELSNYNILTRNVNVIFSNIRFKSFKIAMLNPNKEGNWIMRIANLELYGIIDSPTPRISCYKSSNHKSFFLISFVFVIFYS